MRVPGLSHCECGIDRSYVGEASEHSLFNTSPSLGRTRRMCATGEAAFDVAEEGRKLGCLSRLSSHVGAQSDRLGVLFDSKDSLGAEDEINIRNGLERTLAVEHVENGQGTNQCRVDAVCGRDKRKMLLSGRTSYLRTCTLGETMLQD